MKPESLHALLLDRELGELTPEGGELLDAWLAEHPEAAATLPSLRRTLETTGTALRRFPGLARAESSAFALPAARFRMAPLALAASFALLVGAAGWVGFRFGQAAGQGPLAIAPAAAPAPALVATSDGPWARYALVSGPHGGLTLMRRDPEPKP